MTPLQELKLLRVMSHRYLYYVLGKPVISDQEYDELEAEVLTYAPDDHLIHFPGSDLEDSYSNQEKLYAWGLLRPDAQD